MKHVLLLSIFFFTTVSQSRDEVKIYNQKRSEYLKKDEENRNILSEIYSMQKKLKKINSERNELSLNKKKIETQIEKMSPLVEHATKKVSEQKIEIQKRLQYIYKFQDMSLLKVLFSSQAPAEMDRNLIILKKITEKDYRNLKSYFKNVASLKERKKELEDRRTKYLALQKNINDKEKQILSQSAKKSALLKKIENQKNRLIGNLKDLRKKGAKDVESAKKEEFLGTLFDPLFFERKGSLQTPIEGKVTQGYGDFTHPQFQTRFRHKGVFFKPIKLDVRTVARGHVAYIENIPGHGITMIVDHGDHYFSTYSHLLEATVKVGDALEDSQKIGVVGDYNPFFGKGLYFELRHFSEPINPKEWLVSRK